MKWFLSLLLLFSISLARSCECIYECTCFSSLVGWCYSFDNCFLVYTHIETDINVESELKPQKSDAWNVMITYFKRKNQLSPSIWTGEIFLCVKEWVRKPNRMKTCESAYFDRNTEREFHFAILTMMILIISSIIFIHKQFSLEMTILFSCWKDFLFYFKRRKVYFNLFLRLVCPILLLNENLITKQKRRRLRKSFYLIGRKKDGKVLRKRKLSRRIKIKKSIFFRLIRSTLDWRNMKEMKLEVTKRLFCGLANKSALQHKIWLNFIK
jgi:hypothetical protein